MSAEESDGIGTINDDTFNWWRQKVIVNQNMNVITLTHQPLYDTVGGSKSMQGHIKDS